MFHEFGWDFDDWDKVAAGTVAGHIIECGAQSSGGNLLKDWRIGEGAGQSRLPDRRGARGRVVRRSPSTPARAASCRSPSVTEQLVYEMGDPHQYITPDGVADFTTIQLTTGGEGPGRRSAASAAAPGHRCSRCPSPISTATRRSARWCTRWPDALRQGARRRRDPPPAAQGPGPRVRADPHRVRRRGRHARPAGRSRRAPTFPRCSSASASARRDKAPSSGSPGRSPRWCSPGRRA